MKQFSQSSIDLIETNKESFDLNKTPVTIHLVKQKGQIISIWGSVSSFSSNTEFQLVFDDGYGQKFPCDNERMYKTDKPENDFYLWESNFKCAVPISALAADRTDLSLFLSYEGIRCRVTSMNYGRYCVTGAELGIYSPLSKDLLIRGAGDCISFLRSSTGRILKNRIRCYALLLSGQLEGARKAVLSRLAVPLIRTYYRRYPLWLINDRIDQAGDNGEAFYRWVIKNRSREITPVFVIHEKAADFSRLSRVGKVIPYGTWKHKLLFLACEGVFSSAGELNFLLPFGNRHIFFRDIVSRKKLVYLQHGVTKSDLSHWLGIREKNFIGFITSAQKERDFILARYGYPAENLWLTGMARFDLMAETLRKYPEPKQITIMPTWRKYLMSNLNYKDGSRAVMDGFEDSAYVKTFRMLTEDPRLKTAAAEYGYSIAFRPHPNVMAHIEKFHFSDDVIIDTRPVAEVFAETALLINDYSSGSMDFSYLYRPVIFYQFDRELFLSGAHTFKEENIDYEEDSLGELVFDHEQLIELIVEYIKSGCMIKKKYKDRIESFFQYHDFNNCQRIYEKAQQALTGEYH